MVVRNNDSMKKKLGDLLVDVGLITQQQLNEAVKVQKEKGGKLGDVLAELNFCSKDVLLSFLGKRSGVSYVSIAQYGDISPDVIAFIPESVARHQTLIPLAKKENILTVAMADPLNVFATDDLKIMTGCEIQIVIASDSEIKEAIDKYYGQVSHSMAHAKAYGISQGPVGQGTEEKKIVTEKKNIELESQIVNMLDALLENADLAGATDVHIEPVDNAVRIRFRIHDKLQEKPHLLGKYYAPLIAHIKSLARMNVGECLIPQYGHFERKTGRGEMGCRVSVMPASFGEKIVLHFLDISKSYLDLDHLGFDEKVLEDYKNIIERPQGLVLVTGPIGSGKTTTLYATLSHLNRSDRCIVTIENPIERFLDSITQVQVRSEVGMTMASGVNALLRQDPDVMMAGEMRDSKMAEALVGAAKACLVFASLDVGHVSEAIPRLVHMDVYPSDIVSSLAAIVSQRLLKMICPNCKESYVLPLSQIKAMGFDGQDLKKIKQHKSVDFYRGKGCGQCLGSGYQGYGAVFGLLVMDDDIRRLIQENKLAGKAWEKGGALTSLREAALDHALKGITTLEEVLRMT